MSRASRAPRVLHVGALPFPSPQGTQAALASMLEESVAAGREVELLTYGGGGDGAARGFVAHASHAGAPLPLRSGPSVQKLVLDARMLPSLHALARSFRPDVIVAHHVEAAALAATLRRVPSVFFAHTDLCAELPTYAPTALAQPLALAGGALDRTLSKRASAVATISPALRDAFARRDPALAEKLRYVPTPWRVPAPITREERASARRQLNLDADDTVLLYAGNLDAYQGLDTLLRATARVADDRPRTRLVVATESAAVSLRASAAAAGLSARLHVTRLCSEEARRRAHAAADVAVVPRLAPGGLPIKLLDALSRGVPCAASPRACAGLPLTSAAAVAHDDTAEALAAAVRAALRPAARTELASHGPAYVQHEHSTARYLTALDALLAIALAR